MLCAIVNRLLLLVIIIIINDLQGLAAGDLKCKGRVIDIQQNTKEIVAQHCQIRVLLDGSFVNANELQTLNLGHNSLSKIQKHAFIVH
jgi:hypothetical protein